jgi:hypothetical protein
VLANKPINRTGVALERTPCGIFGSLADPNGAAAVGSPPVRE